MKVGIISIGDELMNGFTVDSNSSWISRKITSYEKLQISANIVVGDSSNQISDNLDNLIKQNYKYIFITGGLGPTHDDITKQALCEYFNYKIKLNKEFYAKLKIILTKKGIKNIKHIKSQCEILECSKPIINEKGTALGMSIVYKKSKIFVLPGVPNEMKAMFDNQIIPKFINPFFVLNKKYLTILTTGIYESKLYDLLKRLIDENKTLFKVAFLPNYTGVKIRISLIKESMLNDDLIFFRNLIVEKIKKYIYGFNDDKIEDVVVKKMINKQLTIAVAESCTGGLLSKKITDVTGSSKCFLGSIIAYDNRIKENFLNISKDVILEKGAVSKEVALLMANKIKNKFDSDIGIGITGISGPGNLETNKELGLVYIGIVKHNIKIVKQFNIIPQRDIHRKVSSHTALNLLRIMLEK